MFLRQIFAASMTEDDQVIVQRVTGFKLGRLPVSYLGLPLVSRELSINDCNSRLEKIQARVNGWAT